MKTDDGLTEFVLDQLSGWGGVSARKMFGGVGLYRDGKMFALLHSGTAFLKVDGTNQAAYEHAGSKPFKPYADRPMTMSYWEVPPEVLDDAETLIEWAQQSLEIQKKAK